jgi:hypothetical protein
MKEANLNSSAPEPGTTLLSAAHEEAMQEDYHYDKQEHRMQIIEEIKGKSYYIFSPDPTARMPD